MCQWRANAMQGVVRRGRGGVEISGRDGGLVGWGVCGSRRVDGPCPAPGTHGRMLLLRCPRREPATHVRGGGGGFGHCCGVGHVTARAPPPLPTTATIPYCPTRCGSAATGVYGFD